MRSSLVALCLLLLVVDFSSTTVAATAEVQDGPVETVEAAVGHGLTLQCHLPDVANVSSAVTVRWERWATYHGAGPDANESKPRTGESLVVARRRRRRRHHHHHHRRRSRRLIHQGSALRFASISEADEGLYRCVGSSSSSSSFIDSTSVDEGGRGELDDPRSLILDHPDADNVTIVSAINDTEQQSGVVTSPSTDDGGDGGDDPRVVTTSTPSSTPVYGSFIYLRVQVAAVLTDYPESPVLIHPLRQQRRKQRLKCLAFGHPTPVIHWRINNNESLHQQVRLVEEADDEPIRRPQRGYIRSVVAIDWESSRQGDQENDQDQDQDDDDDDNNWQQTVNVTCSASNTIARQTHTDTRMFNLERVRPGDVRGEQEDEANDNQAGAGYCGRYTGNICRGQLSNPASVWYNISSNDQTGGWLNEQLVHGLWDEVVNTLREPCKSAAKKLLCLYAFPECHLDEDGFARKLPLCYEDCMATRQLFCVDDWAQLESNKQRGFYLGSRGHFRLPKCEKLPRIGSRSFFMSSSHSGSKYGQDPPSCSRAHLTQLVPAEVTTSCIKGRGRFYQGNVSVTRDGIACQRWDAQEPHSHNRPPLNIFPEMQGAENFCRNAGGEEPRPWCYTTDPLVRWQPCDIPQCGHSEVEVTLLPMEATFTPGFVLLLAGVGFLSLLIFLLFLLLCQRAFKHKQGYQLPSLQKESIDLQKLRDNSTYQCVGARIDPSLEKLEYPRNDIIYIRDIGQGAFGRVFQAKAPNLVKGEACSIVAVKTLKEEADDEMCANFEKEACLLAELDHPNIIGLLGVCAVGKPMCLLLEFMELGDLRQYLRSCCPSNYIAMPESSAGGSSGDIKDVKLSAADLTSMGRQIADGMVYLSQRGFVHRDLATRNCLVSSNGPPSSGGGVTVKIADFGLSQRVHWQQYYYTGTDNDAIPIRWMPLESIIFNRYTTSSDVWAFGVCLWEIFSYAQQPYHGMSHEEVVRYLQAGGMLQPPAHASCAIYAVMRSCWHSSAGERPSFVDLHDELVAIEEALCCQPRPDTDPPPVHL
ncbi:putative Neurospecific receptor kinase protein [Daphnia pulex]|uniref:receptor protein-tyrosine kinase n=1 Tax=Daphnia pulex TaxID=6669 RepID=E9GJW4_DAPPU|nr:putative Neurospecific receptor kinase protein [Daphnia pulex]|eukprot:EFX80185.1 putative Neurospecific receptor kinase protein [Daphnia pulex]